MQPMPGFRLSCKAPEGTVHPMTWLWKYWLRLRAAARTRKELHALSDHLLRDLGLRRSQIDSLFR